MSVFLAGFFPIGYVTSILSVAEKWGRGGGKGALKRAPSDFQMSVLLLYYTIVDGITDH